MSGQRAPRFKDRAELLDFLLELTTVTSSTLNLDKLLAMVGDYVRQMVPCDLAAILIYSERHKGLIVRHAHGLSEERTRGLVIPLDEGLTGIAASARMPVVVGDVVSDPRYIAIIDAIRSEMAVPIIARNRLVGVIDVQSAERDAFTSEDSALVQLIASHVASFLLHAKLFRRLERSNLTLRTLTAVSREFSSILDVDDLLSTMAARVRGMIDYTAFSVLLPDHARGVLRHRFSIRHDEQVRLDHIPMGKGITGAAAATRTTIRVEDTRSDPRYIETIPSTRSEIAVPLIAADGVAGVMNLESERVGYFTEEHTRLLELIAPYVTSAVVNARLYEEITANHERMEADLAAARRLQAVLLPREDPELTGLECGIAFRPAHEITGDVFDFFEQGDDYAIISVGDVSGKSAAAALYGAMVTGLLRTLAPRRKTPAALMRALNEALIEHNEAGKYLTLLVLLWQPKTRMLTMSNAAGIPPMVCRDGALISPQLEGFPLGMFPDRHYDESPFQTMPGDVILLYSDGIQDQAGPAGAAYGESRLAVFFPTVAHLPAKQIVEAILADFDQFRAGRPIHDDQTLVALRVR